MRRRGPFPWSQPYSQEEALHHKHFHRMSLHRLRPDHTSSKWGWSGHLSFPWHLHAAILLGRMVIPLASLTVLISSYLHLIFRQTPLGTDNAAFLQDLLYFSFVTQTASCFDRSLGTSPKGGLKPMALLCIVFQLRICPGLHALLLKVGPRLCSKRGRKNAANPSQKTPVPACSFWYVCFH